MARVEGNRAVPLKVMCSMKCATPASAGVSRREPARTYAAMETERAPGSRALMTRGPDGSAVRSNIALDGTGRGRHPREHRPPLVVWTRAWPAITRSDIRVDPVLHEVDKERNCHRPEERVDLGDLATDDLDDDM